MSFIEDISYEQLKIWFPKTEIIRNHRPKWLCGLEIDFYIPEFQLAIEIQGLQHFAEIPKFHKTNKDFKDQLIRDWFKKRILKHLQITFVSIPQKTAFLNILRHCIRCAAESKKNTKIKKEMALIRFADKRLSFKYLKYWHENKENFFRKIKDCVIKEMVFPNASAYSNFNKFIKDGKHELALEYARSYMIVKDTKQPIRDLYGCEIINSKLKTFKKQQLQCCLYLLSFHYFIDTKSVVYYQHNPQLFDSCSFRNKASRIVSASQLGNPVQILKNR